MHITAVNLATGTSQKFENAAHQLLQPAILYIDGAFNVGLDSARPKGILFFFLQHGLVTFTLERTEVKLDLGFGNSRSERVAFWG